MEFGFTEEQEKLRKEVREFFLNELPEDYEPGYPQWTKEQQAYFKQLAKKSVKRGYYVPSWPKEVGGAGMTHTERAIVHEQEQYFGFRYPDYSPRFVHGPAIMLFGTEEQKKTFLPLFAYADTISLNNMTEPQSGTDEANIQTRAVEDGDDFIVNGQKCFISGTYKTEWLFTNVRTLDIWPPHRGISILYIPANLPGVTFRPLPYMGGGGGHEVFFDNVRVPKKYLIGQLNRGFYHTMQTLEFERGGTGAGAGEKRELEEFIEFCRETKVDGKPLWDDPQVRDTVAQIAIDNEVIRLEGWASQWRFLERERVGPARYGNINLVLSKTISPLHAKAMLDILGLYGQVRTGSKWAALRGRLERTWEGARSVHAGGGLEIAKNLLAERGLGLPRLSRDLWKQIGEYLKGLEPARR